MIFYTLICDSDALVSSVAVFQYSSEAIVLPVKMFTVPVGVIFRAWSNEQPSVLQNRDDIKKSADILTCILVVAWNPAQHVIPKF